MTTQPTIDPILQKRLHDAVQQGNADAYIQALDDGADPFAPAPGNDTDLVDTTCKAVLMHNLRLPDGAFRFEPTGDHAWIVEHLVRHVGLVPDDQHPGLLSAARSGHVDLVRRLAGLGYNPRGFNDRALELATEMDARERTGSPTPHGHHRPTVRALLDLGCSLDSGKGESRQKLTSSFEHEAKCRGVLDLNLPALQKVWAEAESFGVVLNANVLLSQMVMQSTLRTTRQDTTQSVDELAIGMVNALVERGGWTNRQHQVGCGTNGSFVLFAAKNNLIALLDHFVTLGADPRMDGDKPLMNAAMGNQRAMVNHLVEQHGADLGAFNGQVRTQLLEELHKTWTAAASAGQLEVMQADDAQARAWGIDLPTAHAFNNATLSSNGHACEAWLADRVEPSSWEEALRNHVVTGQTGRAQAWMDRLTANGQALNPDLQETLFVLAARKNQTAAILWLKEQGLDLLAHGPAALKDLDDRPNRGHDTTIQWLANQIEQEQLRREIAAVAPNLDGPLGRRRL